MTPIRDRTPILGRRGLALLVALVALAAGVGARAAFFAAPSGAAAGNTDIFSASCRPSHVAPDDPIVFPDQPGASHMHEFSGAWSTNAFSTAGTLRASGTTCDPADDTAAYWMPVLYVKGTRVPPLFTTAYFAPGRKNSPAQRSRIKAWPQGFRMIADLKNATVANTGYPHAGWLCGSTQVSWGYNSSLQDILYHCPDNLQVRVIFPDCWDGVNLDTVKPDGTPAVNPYTHQPYPNDHRSHVAYALASGDCPKDHPVETPRLDYKVVYETKGLVDSVAHRPAVFTRKSHVQSTTPLDPPSRLEGNSSSDFTLAGGGTNGAAVGTTYPLASFHADFYNSWKQSKLSSLIDYCIRRQLAITDTRPCLNPNNDAVRDAKPNPNYPNATPVRTARAPLIGVSARAGALTARIAVSAQLRSTPCTGTVTFGIRTAGRVLHRTAKAAKGTCTVRTTVRVKAARGARVRVTAAFNGNTQLAPRRAAAVVTHVRASE